MIIPGKHFPSTISDDLRSADIFVIGAIGIQKAGLK